MTQHPIKKLILIAEFAVFLAVFSQFTIPIAIIPLTLQTFAVGIIVSILPLQMSLATLFIYVLLGLIGLPVFANLHSGIATLAGPTGGYIIGFFVYSLVTGLLLAKRKHPTFWQLTWTNLVGATCQLLVGSLWLTAFQNMTITKGLLIGFIPFIIPGIIKIIGVSVVVGMLLTRLRVFQPLK